MWVDQYDVSCGVVVNGVRLSQPHCRTAEECVEEILRDYKRELEKLKEPSEAALVIKLDPAEELLREWPELQAFGVEWVRKWLDLYQEKIKRGVQTKRPIDIHLSGKGVREDTLAFSLPLYQNWRLKL